jgi:hypothetical protein
MKMFLLGAAVGLVVGTAITIMYFALVTLFTANAKFSAAKAQREETALKEREIVVPAVTVDEKAQGVGA